MVDESCFEEISCEEFYGDPDPSIEVDYDAKLISCLSAQATAEVLLTQYNTGAMRSLIFEMIDSLNLCEELLRSKISEKDEK